MIRLILMSVLGLVMLIPGLSFSKPQLRQQYTAVDSFSRRIILNKPATRIISLSPNVTEMLFAIGAGDAIVGIDDASNYPRGAQRIDVVASKTGVDLEAVLLKKPDLVIVWPYEKFQSAIAMLIDHNIPVFFVEIKKIQDIPNMMLRLAELTDERLVVKQAVKNFKTSYDDIKRQYKDRGRVKVFYQLWSRPLMTIGRLSLINQAIELCGARNVFGNLVQKSAVISRESVIKRNPTVMVNGSQNLNWKIPWLKFKSIKAVEDQNFITVNPDLLQRAAPRILDGVARLCKKIHR